MHIIVYCLWTSTCLRGCVVSVFRNKLREIGQDVLFCDLKRIVPTVIDVGSNAETLYIYQEPTGGYVHSLKSTCGYVQWCRAQLEHVHFD